MVMEAFVQPSRPKDAAQPREIRLHAVIYQSGEWWIAACLEHCFVTQARTEEALLVDLERIIKTHIFLETERGRDPFVSIPRAPQRFWKMYEDAAAHPLDDLQVSGSAEVQPIVELRAA
ncbi:MAG TPA: hypothetical protein VIE43_25155 [Thermoanaerobaculia bacterium]|jgi:hypothetical protein|nr:hypothetical protein [Thermoanaerobaculia bacterium]